ncbi:MAG: acetyl-CoA carboxylase biotin carboxylase subunit [Candidatus Nitrosopolaris wilkensis]|nr:MAG: acetyl-CoA carboxylase biotin carboxylase subunit [Candidatus Nitrosopolaris wilkensis]
MGRVISSILIANRGEIALRIIRAAKELGIKAIAVYSDEDARSLHVKRADEAYHIGPSSASESYLNTKKITETATTAGADAIHPGYGFLSEDENFADTCEKKGIIFIGPNSRAMAVTGDKMKCKALMKKANIPVIPGSDGNIDDVDKAESNARNIGYPVLLKSAFGGGGRGIRLVKDEKQLRQEFEIAAAESKAAFGKAALYVEKGLERIRHIEFQLVRDSYGNTRHLFERECSIQRRHQKLIEMSPSPVVSAETRQRIGEIAIKAAEIVNYLNAGTAEFLRDKDGNFYFIEINSRLQVEHPVTELVTGLDLVKLQISIAQGEEISFKQRDLKMHGCSIECRINAEDPFYDFAPSVGTVRQCNLPQGPGIRVDSYLYPGCTVSGYYDSLVAKIITWGQDRQEARSRMKNALREFSVEGISTIIPLHETIMNNPDFIRGEISTDYLDRLNILDVMRREYRDMSKRNALVAIAAILLQSESIRRTGGDFSGMKKSARVSSWKNLGRSSGGV